MGVRVVITYIYSCLALFPWLLIFLAPRSEVAPRVVRMHMPRAQSGDHCSLLACTQGRACLELRQNLGQELQGACMSVQKGGEMTVDLPGQHVLERTSVTLDSQVC